MDVVVVVDSDRRFLSVNDAACRFYERPREELLGVRLESVRPGLRTLFVSGYTAETVRERGRLPAGSAFLEKPFDQLSLLRAVRSLLGHPARRPR